MRLRTRSLAVCTSMAAGLLLAACQQPTHQGTAAEGQPVDPLAGAPRQAKDGDWIRLGGTVVSALPGMFTLDYGPDNITVEMDDESPLYQEGSMIRSGDHVVVTGKIDDDLYRSKKIEAASVFVKEANALFHANPADEENPVSRAYGPDSGQSYVDLVGRVSAVKGRQFTLNTGRHSILVDTHSLKDNPLDAEGRQQVREGDRVYVWGDLELSGPADTKIAARGITTLG